MNHFWGSCAPDVIQHTRSLTVGYIYAFVTVHVVHLQQELSETVCTDCMSVFASFRKNCRVRTTSLVHFMSSWLAIHSYM